MSLLKDLGPLQLKILKYLSENPEKHKQGIQQALEYPGEQYASIHHAVNALEKMGYIKANEGLSEKKVKIKFYSPTDIGIFYVLSKHRKFDPTVLKILENNRDKYHAIDFFLSKYREMDTKFFETFYHVMITSLPLASAGGKNVIQQLLFQMVSSVDSSETDEFIKGVLRYFPETRKSLEKIRDLLNDLLSS